MQGRGYKCAVCHDLPQYKYTCPNCSRNIQADLAMCEKASVWNMDFAMQAREALPYYIKRVQELVVKTAVMQQAIESARNDLLMIPGSSEPETWFDDALQKLENAIPTNDSKELLERIKKLEAVAEISKVVFVEAEKCGFGIENWDKLEIALADLEGDAS